MSNLVWVWVPRYLADSQLGVANMTITIELEADQEARLKREAAREGVTVRVYVRRLLERYLAPSPVRDAEAEADLLRQTGIGLTEAEWAEYHHLAGMRRSETLTAADQARLIELTDAIEMANARRLAALAQLARMRGTNIDALMDTLGLGSPGYDEASHLA